jgi:hypothetical protein
MATAHRYHRPPFEDTLAAWKAVLKERGYSQEIVWILEENLCYEKDDSVAGGIKLGYQVQFTPLPADSAKVTYHHFAETDARIVFYRVGASRGRSVCMVLCDEWFEPQTEKEGYLRHDEWLVSFFPGGKDEMEEVSDRDRWQKRVVRGRPLTAVDFCMTFAALRELKAHGRVLEPDERMGLTILRSMGGASEQAR